MVVLSLQHDLQSKPLDSQIGALSSWVEVDENLARQIIMCEGGFGEVKTNVNPAYYDKRGNYHPATTDKGPLQINSIHYPEMEKNNLNPENKTDSLIYGFYLWNKEGLKHWSASKSCWDKQTVAYNKT